MPWPTAGMTRNGIAYRRTPSVHRKNVIASGLLPTPTMSGNYNRVGASATSGDGLFTVVRAATNGARPGSTALARFVEWLMGYPVDWSRASHSATP